MCLKGLLLLTFLAVFGLSGSSQSSFKDTLFLKYRTDRSTLNRTHIYYLVQLKQDAPQYFINKISTGALRKLSASFYIIDTFVTRVTSDNSYIADLFPVNNFWKLSPSAEKTLLVPVSGKLLNTYQVLFSNVKFAEAFLLQNPLLNKEILLQQTQNIISLKCSAEEIKKSFLNNDNVIFIDMIPAKPKEELGTPGYDLSANKLNVVHNEYPAITGSGQHVSVKENYYDTTDIDIKGRFEYSPLASAIVTNHANFIATIIAGAGNSVHYARGAAKEAIISSSSFEPVLPDADNAYVQNNITVQNHSYGTVIENNYGLSAMAFDKSANNNERLLHVFSSGNAGSSSSTSGPYNGIAGFANLTGNFKMAKNIITVGAVDSFGILAPLSSKGPAYDGRIKPELVAFQQNGTSEAAALVSGTTLLLQQYYRQQHPLTELPSSLAKAILLNTADDIYNPGPDFKTGFGNLNAIKAMDLVRDNKIFTGTVSSSSAQSFMINIPANISKLKVTLVWNDIAATPLAFKALINDLDLEVSLPAANISWKPWVLNSFPNVDSLDQFATRKRDSLNNVEQVTIANPAQGNYEIKISGFNIPSGSQKYHVAYSWDSLNFFKWYRPTDNDLVEAGRQSVLRWENSYSGNGDIEYKLVSSNTWQTLATNVDLHQNYIYWNVPDTISQAILRMKAGNQYYYSDTFTITTLLKPTTGYVCGDSILVYWNKLKNIHQYQVYQLGQKFMIPLFIVSDTVAVINKNILTDKFLAVAPILDNGVIATKSYAFNYNAQGAGCYINSFYVSRNGDVARLNLSLGSVINVVAIDFEKKTPAGYVSIGNSLVTNQLQYFKNFNPLTPGITYFRVKITLQNGQVIYSDPEAVFYTAPGNYVLLPVPVNRYSDITLITSLPDGEIITFMDILGRKVLQQTVISNQQRIRTSQLQSGEYFYFITKKGSRVATGKLLIL